MSDAPDALETSFSAIGRTATVSQMIDPTSLARFEAAVGVDECSPLSHWAYFGEIVPDELLGEDGHPRRGEFLPAIETLPRRMFASASIAFLAPIVVGSEATLTLRIVDVRHKRGSNGELVLVDVERAIAQFGSPCVRELQTLAYLPAPTRDLVSVGEGATLGGGEIWLPGPINLFRFSAATFNGHRIHYDRVYATDVEGYPDLVVQGPFTAARLAALANRRGTLTAFSFRAHAPCFVDRPVRLVEIDGGLLQAIREDGVISMTARATY